MAMTCSICKHPKRAEIDRAIAECLGSNRAIARQYKLSPASVDRHAKAHLPARVAAAAERKGLAEDDSLLERLQWLEEQARDLLASALADDDLKEANSAIKGIARVLEIRGRGTGEFAPIKVQTIPSNMTPQEHIEAMDKLVEEIATERARVAEQLEGRVH